MKNSQKIDASTIAKISQEESERRAASGVVEALAPPPKKKRKGPSEPNPLSVKKKKVEVAKTRPNPTKLMSDRPLEHIEGKISRLKSVSNPKETGSRQHDKIKGPVIASTKSNKVTPGDSNAAQEELQMKASEDADPQKKGRKRKRKRVGGSTTVQEGENDGVANS